MNKEKLEQMKKERLEQMKELGRGGLSRGLSLLQKANTALATSSAAAASDASDGSDAAAGGGEGATLLSGKPSYDDLVALSMKLTRQNKLMKAQFQKMQARIAELQVSDVDCRVLTAFVSDVVGVDVVACQRTGDAGANGDNAEDSAASTIDVKQLRERYEILDALKTKALKQQIAQLQMQLAAKETNMSLSMAPMAPPPAAATAAVPQYEEIDLLGDAFASPKAVSTAPLAQQPADAFSNDLLSLDFPSVTPAAMAPPPAPGVSPASAVLEKQLDEATEQLRRMEEEMKRSAAENEELRQKFNDLWEQRTMQVEQLTSEKQEVEKRLEAAVSDAQNHLEEAKRQVSTLQGQIEQLKAQTDQPTPKIDTSELEAVKQTLATVQAHNEQLRLQVSELQAATDEAAVSASQLEATVASLKLENDELAKKASLSEEDAVPSEANGASSSDLLVGELRQRLAELEAVNEKLKSEVSSASLVNTSNGSDISTLMEELERVKMARAEADHTAKALQESVSVVEKKLAKSVNEAEQNATVIEALRGEVGNLSAELKRVESEHTQSIQEAEAIKQEKAQVEEAKEALEEQLEVLRMNNSSNLESVVGELAEAKKQVAEQREYMNGKIEVLIRDLDTARKQCESLEASLAEKEKQNQKMASSQSSLTSEVVSLQKQVAAMEQDLQMAAEGLEAHASKAEESELRRREMEEKLKNTRVQIETLKDQHLSDLELMRSGKEAELDRIRMDRSQIQKKLSESEAAYSAISLKFSALQDDLEHEKKRSNDLEARLSQLTAEIGNMSIDLAETKKALSDRMALATRLQTENMGFAETQAEQAARVESALREVASSKQVVVEMESKMQDAKAEVQRFMAERDGAVEEMTRLMQEMDNEKQRMAEERQAQEAKYKVSVESEKEAFRRELERVENDSKHKSKLALHAVLEKEAEIERLSKRLADLEEDVRSGDADNRKIFEFAQMQASREMEARANGAKIHELTRELEVANARVHELQREQARHSEELTAMMQTQRREGVNMEYLKNVIVQFMSFKPGSSQQTRLIPVITTLLQFTAADMKEIKKATSRRSSWGAWGAEAPDYKPIAGTPSATPGSDSGAPTRRRTSPPSTRGSTGFNAGQSLPPRASSFTLPPHDEDSASSADASGAQSADF